VLPLLSVALRNVLLRFPSLLDCLSTGLWWHDDDSLVERFSKRDDVFSSEIFQRMILLICQQLIFIW
jgi:hypothetical protein